MRCKDEQLLRMTLVLPDGIIQMENYSMKLKFCGAAGTRGAAIVGGAQWIRIRGEDIPVRVEVVDIDAFSAHADAGELLSWMRNFKTVPRQAFLSHRKAAPAAALKASVERELGWHCAIAADLEEVSL
jgi:metallo-beta-lactamase family protein